MHPGTALRMPCTDSHRGNTHHMSVSVAAVRTNMGNCHWGPKRCLGGKRVREHRAQVEQRGCCAHVASAAAGSAAMMPELSPVLVERWHGPRSDCRHAAGATSAEPRERGFAFVHVLSTKEMQVACPVSLSLSV